MVDGALCTGCGDCIDVCAEETLSLEQGLLVIDAPRCTACGACVEECPTEALSIRVPLVTQALGAAR